MSPSRRTLSIRVCDCSTEAQLILALGSQTNRPPRVGHAWWGDSALLQVPGLAAAQSNIYSCRINRWLHPEGRAGAATLGWA